MSTKLIWNPPVVTLSLENTFFSCFFIFSWCYRMDSQLVSLTKNNYTDFLKRLKKIQQIANKFLKMTLGFYHKAGVKQHNDN